MESAPAWILGVMLTDPAVVPVVSVDGRARFRGGVNRVLLERVLRSGGEEKPGR